jgi:hypothetical protein
MFDSYSLRAVTERVTENVNVNVTEKRAPTDESVRLLREMEDRAQARIVATTRVQDMGIDCVIHKMLDIANCETKYAVIYSLNGKKHRVDHVSNDLRAESRDEAARRVARELMTAMAEHMAINLLAGAFRNFKEF